MASKLLFVFLLAMVAILTLQETDAALQLRTPRTSLSGLKTRRLINLANKNGPYLGIVIPNDFEMSPLLNSPSYTPSDIIIDFQGRRFRFGKIAKKNVILVMTGLGMVNAGVTTQLLLSTFDIEGIVHYGIAGNANPSLHIGDVAIPQYWAHTGLWNWQRYGQGPEDELPFESGQRNTRDIGYLNFANYTTNVSNSESHSNLLNNIWYQREELFFVDGTPEIMQQPFWVPVDPYYFEISKTLEGLKLKECINATTCISHTPKVAIVERGTSANIYLDNTAYRSFIYNKFGVSPVDMESAGVALVSYQQSIPFIIFRAFSDLAGGDSDQLNEASTFSPLAADNSVTVVAEFIKKLSSSKLNQDV